MEKTGSHCLVVLEEIPEDVLSNVSLEWLQYNVSRTLSNIWYVLAAHGVMYQSQVKATLVPKPTLGIEVYVRNDQLIPQLQEKLLMVLNSVIGKTEALQSEFTR